MKTIKAGLCALIAIFLMISQVEGSAPRHTPEEINNAISVRDRIYPRITSGSATREEREQFFDAMIIITDDMRAEAEENLRQNIERERRERERRERERREREQHPREEALQEIGVEQQAAQVPQNRPENLQGQRINQFVNFPNDELSVTATLNIPIFIFEASDFSTDAVYNEFRTISQNFIDHLKNLFKFEAALNSVAVESASTNIEKISRSQRISGITLDAIFRNLKNDLEQIRSLKKINEYKKVDGRVLEFVGSRLDNSDGTDASAVKNGTASVGRAMYMVKDRSIELYLSALKYLVFAFYHIGNITFNRAEDNAIDKIQIVASTCKLVEDMLIFKVKRAIESGRIFMLK